MCITVQMCVTTQMCMVAQMCCTCADDPNTENPRISEWNFLGRQKIEKKKAIGFLE